MKAWIVENTSSDYWGDDWNEIVFADNYREAKKKATHTGPMPVEQHRLYKHKDEILQMRNEQELPFSVIGRRYNVSGTTIKNFLVKLQQVGD